MAKGFQKGTGAIQKLLDERQQIQTWLERLAMAADTTPETVRARVQADYERRLAEVTKELQAHGAELGAALERLRGAQAGFAQQEREAAERLAEAELRHAVGEYDEAQWRQVHAELLGTLVKIREELKRADGEIARLEEVMAVIRVGPVAAGTAEPVAPPAEPTRKEPVPERRAAPAAARPAGSGVQTDAFDELAFLRSVTEDEVQGPAPSRASGAIRAIPEPVPTVPPVAESVPVELPAGEFADPEAAGKDQAQPRSSTQIKSLQCKECGAMNLPTEWYCERCGAELAAL